MAPGARVSDHTGEPRAPRTASLCRHGYSTYSCKTEIALECYRSASRATLVSGRLTQHLLPSAGLLVPRRLLKWALHTTYIRSRLSIIVTHSPVSIERKSPMSEAAERVEA